MRTDDGRRSEIDEAVVSGKGWRHPVSGGVIPLDGTMGLECSRRSPV
jgi:hypothetical protein